jgi:aspartate aminotransferase
MGSYIDSVPLSGIIRIRDMMYGVKDPYRLDQGDVSFDAPDTVKRAMQRAIEENRSHYLQTTGVPRLLDLLAEKLRTVNQTPIESRDEIMVTTGGIHALYLICHALLEPGDEVILPDPEWPPSMGNVKLARGVVVPCPLHERLSWRFDLDELESKITPKTKAIYINSPHNPTGGVLTREDLERIASIVTERGLWLISDEAYEDVLFDGLEHVSPASLPGMYERTIPFYTFSKTYAMTGLRLGYVAVKDHALRDRMKKVLFYTASNVTSVVQFGGIGALEGSQECVGAFREELQARRDLFYAGVREHADGVLSGAPPRGAFYAFLRIDPARSPSGGAVDSISWSMAQELITQARIGCVPGADFGANGEGYIRFCFARDRTELSGALASMGAVFARTAR